MINLEPIWKSIEWLSKRGQEKKEDRILDNLGPQNRNWQWQSGHGVVSRMKRDAAHKFAAALFPPQVTGWSSFISWLRVLPCRFRYRYHRTFVIPSKSEADRVLRSLWKRGLLICSSENPGLYQLKR